MGSIPCLLYTILCVVFEARVINLCDRDIATLNMQIKENDVNHQRENIFHTRCHIQNKVCSMIINGGSCANVTSDTIVKKLNLSCIKHPRPYIL